MLTYWLILLLMAWQAINHIRLLPTTGLAMARWKMPWRASFVLLTLVIGLRHEVGGDWEAYLNYLNGAYGANLISALAEDDPAFDLLNWFGANVWGGVYFVNMVCAALFSWGLLTFCRAQPRPWLAMVVAVPYLITVVAMGYTRQGVAIGLAMLGLAALIRGSVQRFVLWVAMAALFHKSAVILIPLAIFSGSKHRFLTLIGVAISAVVLFVLLLRESFDVMVAGYVLAEYHSSGAAVRVAMNALPAALFLLFRKRFALSPAQREYWTWMALAALGFVILLIISPSSTAVDRLALYWIPLQLFVWSRLPDVLGRSGLRNKVWVYSVVGYSSAQLFSWLFFADNAFAWLPYQFYPWVWLWS